jgi:hypothetical protein
LERYGITKGLRCIRRVEDAGLRMSQRVGMECGIEGEIIPVVTVMLSRNEPWKDESDRRDATMGSGNLKVKCLYSLISRVPSTPKTIAYYLLLC